MSELSSLNTSLNPGLIEGFAPKSLQAIVPVERFTSHNRLDNNSHPSADPEKNSDVNLNNYYADEKIENWLSKIGNNVVKSSNELDKTMVLAIQNGYSVQDACNIRKAEIAYKATAYVFNIAEEMSTFALDV